MSKKLTNGLYSTIDIGTSSIKAIVIEVNGKDKRLLKAQSVDLAARDTFTNDEEYDQQITDAIAKLAKDLNLSKCQKVISLFYNRDLQVKLLDLPNSVKIDQLNQMLSWEAKKLLSSHYKEEEFAYSYCITRENPVSLVLAVTPMSLLNAHLKLFENTGIKPDSVYTDVFASLALQPIIDIAGLPALSIVDFGYSGTHLNIFSAGKLRFYRYIPTGTSEMGNPPTENELEMYSQKIRFSFDYFRAVSKLSQVDALFFMGGGSTMPDIMKYEQNYFAPTKINLLDVSSALDISPVMSENLNEPSTTNAGSSQLLAYVPAIGSCLADFRDDSETMDLLTLIKQQEKEKKLEKLANTLPILLGIIAFIIAGGILYFLHTENKNKLAKAKIDLDEVKQELVTYQEKIKAKTASEQNTQIKLSKDSLEIVKPIIANKNSVKNLFQVINKSKTKNIQISEILIRNLQEAEQINLKTKDELEAESIVSKADMSDETLYSEEKVVPTTKKASNDDYDIFSEPETQAKTNNYVKASVSKKTNSAIYSSKLSTDLSEQQIKEDFDGKIAVIHGFANNALEVSRFSDLLTATLTDENNQTQPSGLMKYIGITLRETTNQKVEFLLKGELK